MVKQSKFDCKFFHTTQLIAEISLTLYINKLYEYISIKPSFIFKNYITELCELINVCKLLPVKSSFYYN